jgi:hypothetical protein
LKVVTPSAVADIICQHLEELDLAYPKVSKIQQEQLLAAKVLLEQENPQ